MKHLLYTDLTAPRANARFINVYSEVGKGARFKIYFLAELPADTRDRLLFEQSTVPRGNGELILVVDDEEAIRSDTRRTLERYGYRIMLASNGAEAVAYFRHNAGHIRPSVVLEREIPRRHGGTETQDGRRALIHLLRAPPCLCASVVK